MNTRDAMKYVMRHGIERQENEYGYNDGSVTSATVKSVKKLRKI